MLAAMIAWRPALRPQLRCIEGSRTGRARRSCRQCARLRRRRAGSRRRCAFWAGRRGLLRLVMVRLYAHVEQQVMDYRFKLFHFGQYTELANGAAFYARPSLHFALHMVEKIVDAAGGTAKSLGVASMLAAVDELGSLQKVVSFAVNLGKVRIVRVIIVQVQAKLIGQRDKMFRQLRVMPKGAEFNRHRALHHMWPTYDYLRRRRGVIVRVFVGIVRAVSAGRRHDIKVLIVMLRHRAPVG